MKSICLWLSEFVYQCLNLMLILARRASERTAAQYIQLAEYYAADEAAFSAMGEHYPATISAALRSIQREMPANRR